MVYHLFYHGIQEWLSIRSCCIIRHHVPTNYSLLPRRQTILAYPQKRLEFDVEKLNMYIFAIQQTWYVCNIIIYYKRLLVFSQYSVKCLYFGKMFIFRFYKLSTCQSISLINPRKHDRCSKALWLFRNGNKEQEKWYSIKSSLSNTLRTKFCHKLRCVLLVLNLQPTNLTKKKKTL